MTKFDTRDDTDVALGRDAYPEGRVADGNERAADRPKPGPGVASPRPGPAARRSRLRVPTFDLSLTQLVATGLAAVTATIAASYLGVAGTVIGAAVASVLSAVGNAVYGQSLRTTRDRVREVVPVTLLRTGTTTTLPTRPAAGNRHDQEPPALPAARPGPLADPDPVAGPSPRRILWKRVALVATTMFLTVLAVITGIELAAGRPLADLLRGDSGSGTSVFGGTTVKTRTVPPTAPTVYVTVTPQVVVTTPTYTRTASPATTTTTGTATPSAPTSATPTATRTSGAPSSSGSATP